MDTDTWISVCLGLVTIAMAYLGVHVTLHPVGESRRTRWLFKCGFGGFALVALTLLAWQGQRANASRRDTENQQRQLREELKATHKDIKLEREAISGLIGRSVQGITTPIEPRSLSREEVKTRPDIALEFVYPQSLSYLFVNKSTVTAREPKFWCVLFNLDEDRGDGSSQTLPMQAQIGDFIRPGWRQGPNPIADSTYVTGHIKPGNRIFGFAGVTCPDCIASRCYWVYVKAGAGGWYAPIKPGLSPKESTMFKLIPIIKKNPDRFVADIPERDRIPIPFEGSF